MERPEEAKTRDGQFDGSPSWRPGPIAAAAVVLIALFILWGGVVHSSAQSVASNTFGDAFGPFASFSALVALCFALWAVQLQQKELAETRKAIAGQRAEAQLKARLQRLRAELLICESARERSSHTLDTITGRLVLNQSSAERLATQSSFIAIFVERAGSWFGNLRPLSRRLIQLRETPNEVPAEAKIGGAAHPPTRVSPIPAKLLLGGVVVLSASALAIWSWLASTQPKQAAASAAFGDAFAPLTGLATVLALLTALQAIRLQQAELRMTRRELEGQRRAACADNAASSLQLALEMMRFCRQLTYDLVACIPTPACAASGAGARLVQLCAEIGEVMDTLHAFAQLEITRVADLHELSIADHLNLAVVQDLVNSLGDAEGADV